MKLDEYIRTKKSLGEWNVDKDIALANTLYKLTLIKNETPESNTSSSNIIPKFELISNQDIPN